MQTQQVLNVHCKCRQATNAQNPAAYKLAGYTE